MDPRRHFIIKLWHHHDNIEDRSDQPDLDLDHVIGFAAVDLSPLKSGVFPMLSGWYNVMDFVGRCRGQIKIQIKPVSRDLKSLTADIDSSLLRRDSEITIVNDENDKTSENNTIESTTSTTGFSVVAQYDKYPSHVIQHTEQLVTATHALTQNLTQDGTHNWTPPDHLSQPEHASTHSFLKNKLSELDKTTKKLQNMLIEDETEERAVPTAAPYQELSLEQLQSKFEAQLSALRGISTTVTAPTESPSSPSSSVATVSQEIREVLTLADLDSGRQLDSGLINRSTLEDLGQIDWSRVAFENDDPTSRQGPEGGNPTEEDGATSANNNNNNVVNVSNFRQTSDKDK